MKARFFVTLTLLSAIIPKGILAQDYKGAEALLNKLAALSNAKEEKKADPVEALRLRIRAFRDESPALAPDEAARRWVALYDTYVTIPAEALYSQRSAGESLDTRSLIAALPPSSAWNALASAIEKRPDDHALRAGGLALLASVLRSDVAGRKEGITKLAAVIKRQDKLESYERQQLEEYLKQFSQVLDTLSGSSADKLVAFRQSLDDKEKLMKAQPGFGGYLEVPDLVKLAGKEEAERLILRAIRDGFDDITFDGEETRSLAARLALDHVGELKKPLWRLVDDISRVPLYEALDQKFQNEGRNYERREATAIYLLGLIASGRADDAVEFTRKISKSSDGLGADIRLRSLDALKKAGLQKQVLQFLEKSLESDPDLPYWDDFIDLAANQSESARALALLKSAMARPGLSANTRGELESHYYLALLAADEVDEGIKVLRELIKAGPRAKVSDGTEQAEAAKRQWAKVGVDISPETLRRFQRQGYGSRDDGSIDAIKLASRLASLGKLLGRPELVDEGIAAAKGIFDKLPDSDGIRSLNMSSIVNLLLESGRGPEAEEVIYSVLAEAAKPGPENIRGRSNSAQALGTLAFVYSRAGRFSDVLKLLDQSPLWGAPDLAALETVTIDQTPLLLLAASALNATGRKDDARKLIRRAAQDYPSDDKVYMLLLEVGTDNLESYLDELAKRDRFEERPLIWKARVQFDAGRIEEAERTIRKAISIDPSDGEQGKGDRMRAYAILGDILEKKGDMETAEIMRGAVSAIRASEDADDWWTAGLLTRAVKKYEAALKLFADAYCIQSRLAVRYSELGQFDNAEMHYQRAYELMPESFGRVESHCFGCEHVFSGDRAQGVAEKVFTKLVVKMPDRPQVHYLLGYLRNIQNRAGEAAEEYRKAIKLDPDYLNAWKNLGEVAEAARLSVAERERIDLELLRIDPTGRKSSPSLSDFTDLRRLWDTLLAAEKNLPATETGPIYALAAAKEALDKHDPEGRWQSWNFPTLFSQRTELRNRLTQTQIVNATVGLLDTLSRQQLTGR